MRLESRANAMEPTALILALALPVGSVPTALRAAEALCLHMRERRSLCLRLLARMRRLWARELQSAPTPAALANALPALGVFGELLIRFTATLRQYAVDDAVFRLMLSRQLLVKLQRVHDDLDAATHLLMRGRVEHRRLALERLQWEADVRVQMLLDKQRSGYADAAQTEMRRIEKERVMLGKIREALSAGNGRCEGVAVQIEVEEAAYARGSANLAIAKWEVTLHSNEASTSRGVDEVDRSPCQALGADGEEQSHERWVVRAFSACHLCAPVAFAFTTHATPGSSSSPLDFLASHAPELVLLFFQVALCVHLPHESELACDSTESGDALCVCEPAVESCVLPDDSKTERSLLVPCPR